MIKMRVATGLALLVFSAGMRPSGGAPLDDAAERYRPYMIEGIGIEGIGDALAGARALRERAAASELAGAKKAWILARAAKLGLQRPTLEAQPR
jgi:iron uptake system component EfeO